MERVRDGEIFVDRKEEDKAVALYQKTKDPKILRDLYDHRVPTLQNWASKHYYPGLIGGGVDDLFSELSIVFVKAVQKYKPSKGSFNTWLFTLLLNRIKNIKNSRHAKKRTSDIYDGPLNAMVLSLDYIYDEQDSNGNLHGLLEDESIDHDVPMILKETIGILSEKNPKIKKYLIEIGNGSSLAAVIKESKTKRGYLNLPEQKCFNLRGENKNKIKDLIKSKIQKDFNLIDYQIKSKRMYYTIELKKTKESEMIEQGIKHFRKNKEYYCEKLNLDD